MADRPLRPLVQGVRIVIGFRVFTAIGMAVAVMSGASAAHSATTISSTFDNDAEGWRYGTYQSSNTGRAVTYDAGTIVNPVSQQHGGFFAPSQYLGDKSAFIGGEISFDLSSRRVSENNKQRPLIILQGANGNTIFADWGAFPTTSLSDFQVRLTASDFYVGTVNVVSGPVSTQLFTDIMSDLERIVIFADWQEGVDLVHLDNVAMSSAGVPEPATWALMICGFGLTGSALRSRRWQRAA